MGAAASTEQDPETIKKSVLETLEKVKAENTGNLTAKHLSEEFINSLNADDQQLLYKCALSGIENPSSTLGCYAMTPADYDKFNGFFNKVIREYHGDETGEMTHKTNWELTEKKEEDTNTEESKTLLDLTSFGLSDVSMRIRVGRNLAGFNLPGLMTKEERIGFEQKMLTVFDIFLSDDAYKGKVYSLTPDFTIGEEKAENPNLVSEEEYNNLVENHLMFKNMDNDPYLKSAGIASDWPYGRGCYISEAKDFIVWFGEEDQLRIMCMKKGTDLAQVFESLKLFLGKIEAVEGVSFATHESYGYVTSCPSNLGTGMRASVHIQVPKLLKAEGIEKVREYCDELKLSVRGLGGEHTDAGEDGTVDISPKARLFISEVDIVKSLYAGVKQLMEKENAIESTPAE